MSCGCTSHELKARTQPFDLLDPSHLGQHECEASARGLIGVRKELTHVLQRQQAVPAGGVAR